jgi:hypothetical protein
MRILRYLVLLIVLSSCEKNIDFNLDESEEKVVIEATIENGQPPFVVITRSLNYFSEISPEIFASSFIHNAVVTVSNGRTVHRLKEYSIPVSTNYTLYYYSIDSASLATAFVGETEKQYALAVTVAGRQYTAQTTIPAITKQVDSIWWKVPPPTTDSADKKAIVMVKATDPKGYGDYVRYFTRRNSGAFLPGLNSVYDDFFVDGTTYELQVEPGFDRNVKREEEDSFFARGDTVTLKLSNIDKATFDFWRTMEFSYASVGDPFATPVKVLGNISDGALGYFGGYASQYHTIIIPK